MKLKQTRRKIILAAFVVVFLGAAGLLLNKIANTDSTNATENDVIIDYVVEDSELLGKPTSSNNYLNLFDTSTEQRLESWTDVGGTKGEENRKISFSDSNKWKDGMMRPDNAPMRPSKYLLIPSGYKNSTYWNGVYWTTTDKTNKYTVKVSVQESVSSANNQPFLVGKDQNWFAVRDVYESTCTDFVNADESCQKDAVYQHDSSNEYASVYVKLKYEIVNRPKVVYLQIDDIDFAQSYRIENQDICNTVSGVMKCNIFVTNKDAVRFGMSNRKTGEGGTHEDNTSEQNDEDNYINFQNSNYVTIFSSITTPPDKPEVKVVESPWLAEGEETYPDTNNIYLKLRDNEQSTSIEATYGFRYSALSRWNFYAEAYNVSYKALNENNQPIGSIFKYDGTDPVIGDSVDTKIYAGEYIQTIPAIRTSSQNQYQIDYWTADKSVTIGGSTITAGTHITPAQMETLATTFAIENDYVFTAHLKLRTYTINFKDYDNTEIKTFTCTYGENITSKVPVDPERPGTSQYTWDFAGWNPSVNQTCTDHATYIATYTQSTNKYPVRFVNYNDALLQSKNYNYGDMPTYSGQTPTKPADNTYTYEFTGWDKTIVSVTGPEAYKAQFTPHYINYTISFYDEDEETVLGTKNTYHYGDTVQIPNTPKKESDEKYDYIFKKWERYPEDAGYPDIATDRTVKGDAEYIAVYEPKLREYPVKFVDDDGTLLEEDDWPYGSTPVYTGKELYKKDKNCTSEFAGWDKEIVAVTGSATYTATYKKPVCVGTPNTGENKEYDGAAGSATLITIAVIAVLGIISAAVAYRIFVYRKAAKF